jgi:hypothetical protein
VLSDGVLAGGRSRRRYAKSAWNTAPRGSTSCPFHLRRAAPGTYQRLGSVRRVLKRRWTAAFGCLLAGAAVGCSLTDADNGHITASSRGAPEQWPCTHQREVGNGVVVGLVPATCRIRGGVVMPLTFPDGSTVEVSYPATLDLAGLGLTPYTSLAVNATGDVAARDLIVSRASLQHWNGADTGLHLRFGAWHVLIWDTAKGGEHAEERMSQAQRAALTHDLRGRETAAGFLVLRGRDGVGLASAGEDYGPGLHFGGRPGGVFMWLRVGECTQDRVDHHKTGATWCPSPLVEAHAGGSKAAVKAIVDGLTIREVALAS